MSDISKIFQNNCYFYGIIAIRRVLCNILEHVPYWLVNAIQKVFSRACVLFFIAGYFKDEVGSYDGLLYMVSGGCFFVALMWTVDFVYRFLRKTWQKSCAFKFFAVDLRLCCDNACRYVERRVEDWNLLEATVFFLLSSAVIKCLAVMKMLPSPH